MSKNIEEMFEVQISNNPEIIIRRIDDDLRRFLKIIIENDSDCVIICGRKSYLLYNPYIPDIVASDKRVLIVETLKEGKTLGFTSIGKLLILSDSIHKGIDFNQTYGFLNNYKRSIRISRIEAYCLVAFKNGVENLEKKGIKWKAHHIYDDESEYEEHMKDLEVYFHSKNEILETDIPYDKYTIQSNDLEKIHMILKETVKQVFCDKIDFTEDHIHAIPNIKQYSISCVIDVDNSICIKQIPILKKLREINRCSYIFSIKIMIENNHIILTNKYESFIDYSLYGIHKKITEKCRLKYVDIDRCVHLKVNFDRRKKNLKSYICSTCIGNAICEKFLDIFKLEFEKNLSDKEIGSEVIRNKHRLISI